MRYRLIAAFLVIASQVFGWCAADDASPGAVQFKKSCGTCHTIDPSAAPRQGPNLFGVVGRRAGSLAGFKYSPAFTAGKGDIVWDAASIDRWITDPQAMIPGAVMLYKQADPEKRRLVIEFLQTAH